MFLLYYGFGFGVLAFTPSTPKRAVPISVDSCTSANTVMPTPIAVNMYLISLFPTRKWLIVNPAAMMMTSAARMSILIVSGLIVFCFLWNIKRFYTLIVARCNKIVDSYNKLFFIVYSLFILNLVFNIVFCKISRI